MTPNPLGYLTENSLSLYPFKDNSSLTSIRAPYERLANDVILDVLISTDNPDLKRAALSLFEFTYTGQDPSNPKQFLLRWVFVDASNSTVVTIDQTISTADVESYKTFTVHVVEDEFNYALKLVVGPGMVKLVTDNISKSFDFGTNFGIIPNAEILATCMALAHPVVKSFTYDNLDANGEVVEGQSFVHTPDSLIEARYNVDINQNVIQVVRGAGAGLYNNCTEYDGIFEINGVKADANGNINLIADQCYTREDSIGQTQFTHTCNPRCTQDHITAYVYYTNRLKDAMVQLLEYASTGADSVQAKLIELAEEYKTRIALLQQSTAPYLEVQVAKTKNSIRQYFSFAVGIYDPQKNDLLVNFKVVPMTISEPSEDWQYIDETAFLEESNNTFPLPFDEDDQSTWKFIDRKINCRGSVATRFVLSTTHTFSDGHLEFYLSESTESERPSTAYKMHVVNPDGYYFTLKTKRIWKEDLGVYRYTFYVDFFKSALDTSSPSASTNFIISTDELVFVEGSAKIIKNNETPEILAQSNPNFTRTFNYAQRATLVFDADFTPDSDDHTAEFTVIGTMTVGVDVFSKTMTVR